MRSLSGCGVSTLSLLADELAERGHGADRADGAGRIGIDRDAGLGDVRRGQGGRDDQRLVGGGPDLLGRFGLALPHVPDERQHRVDAVRGGQAAVDGVEVLHVEGAGRVDRVGRAAEARQQALQVLAVRVGQHRDGEADRLGHVGHERAGAAGLGQDAEPVPGHPPAGLQGQAEVDHLLHAGGLDQAVLLADGVVDLAGAGDRGGVAQRGPRALFCVARLHGEEGLAEFGGAGRDLDEHVRRPDRLEEGQDHADLGPLDHVAQAPGHVHVGLVAGGQVPADVQAGGDRLEQDVRAEPAALRDHRYRPSFGRSMSTGIANVAATLCWPL